ncbi:dead deah box helicase [Colletotrichum incanum]|uniref:Dead deah box helicase n=1 Tax=Colletotrichum incanum TaxID=1573173 RepID=A0A167D2T7_COLIC|nr:dead deah box helicase [Colletotrichum incanum]
MQFMRLSKLKERGCNFHIIWFDNHRDFAVPPDALEVNVHKYLLTRVVLIEHLRRPEPAADINPRSADLDAPMSFVFPSIASAEFRQYRSQYHLHLIMLSDGRPSELNGALETKFLGIMHLFAQHQYSLAFIDDTEFRSSKVYAHVATPPNCQIWIPVYEPFPFPRPDLDCRRVMERLPSLFLPWKNQRQGRATDAREEVAVIACASILLKKPSAVNERRVAAFLVHIALMNHIILAQRSCASPTKYDDPSGHNEFLEDFSNVAIVLVQLWAGTNIGRCTNWEVHDLVDGRLYYQVLNNLESCRLPVDLSPYIQVVRNLTGADVQRHLQHCTILPKPDPGLQVVGSSVPALPFILPFSHPVLDKYLEEIKLKTETLLNSTNLGYKISQELTHWHNAKKRVDPKNVTRKPPGYFARKRNQNHMADTIAYSASLTNASGKNINPEPVVVQRADESVQKKHHTALPRNKKQVTMSGAAKGRQEAQKIEARKLHTRSIAILKNWDNQCRNFEREQSVANRYWKVLSYLSNLSEEDKQSIGGEVFLYICNILSRKLSYRTHDKPFSDAAPDSRVPFRPDAWQRKVLDAIDADKSLFVVAPTSAGKTFISFYAMKKVLQANDDDVLVYVAPTKALVNQIAAEIQARFSKSYRHEGRSVWAIHTRDYRVNSPIGCQVLVTVPHILQIMLLAPSNAQNAKSWARRVKRIIFDEVHCIGQAEDGIIWEQLLLLAPCPIIALSATVGNPLEFKEWLAGTQKAKGFDLDMIVHNTRYSDLRNFLYQPPTEQEFVGLKPVERLPIPGLDAETGDDVCFAFMHPIGSIVNITKDSLDDASLEPRDCLQLWRTMINNQTDKYQVKKELTPELALPGLVKKSDTIQWGSALKEQLWEWMIDPRSPILNVCNELKPQTIKRNKTRVPADSTESTEVPNVISPASLSLLVDLRSRGALPAILFNYDRVGCEKILFKILQLLQNAEQIYKNTSRKWSEKMTAYKKWKKARETNSARKGAKVLRNNDNAKSKEDVQAAKDSGAAMTRADLARDGANSEISPWENFDPELPLRQFSFADTTKITQEELEERIRSLDGQGIRPSFIHALHRGLAVHHAGMNRQYRQV